MTTLYFPITFIMGTTHPKTVEQSAQESLRQLAERCSVRIEIEPDCTGAENMQRDMALREELTNSALNNMMLVRLYSWKPWCISLGMHQKETDIDVERCLHDGIDMVRRPTGGRAVFHARELTYCIAVNTDNGFSHQDMYAAFHALLCNALRSLGAHYIGFEQSQPKFAELYDGNRDTLSCFASSARYELMAEGKKVVGSAQRKFGTVLLQHGSLLLDSGFEQLALYSAGYSTNERMQFMQSMSESTSTLRKITGREIHFGECASAISSELEKTFSKT